MPREVLFQLRSANLFPSEGASSCCTAPSFRIRWLRSDISWVGVDVAAENYSAISPFIRNQRIRQFMKHCKSTIAEAQMHCDYSCPGGLLQDNASATAALVLCTYVGGCIAIGLENTIIWAIRGQFIMLRPEDAIPKASLVIPFEL